MTDALAFRAKDAERKTARATSRRLPQRDLPFASLAEGRTTASELFALSRTAAPIHPNRHCRHLLYYGWFLLIGPRARFGPSSTLLAIA